MQALTHSLSLYLSLSRFHIMLAYTPYHMDNIHAQNNLSLKGRTTDIVLVGRADKTTTTPATTTITKHTAETGGCARTRLRDGRSSST